MPAIKHNRRKILQYIIDYKRTHDGNSPTVREIMDANGVSSSSAMHYILLEMEDSGMIRFGSAFESRSIQVVGGQWTYNG